MRRSVVADHGGLLVFVTSPRVWIRVDARMPSELVRPAESFCAAVE